ncbi:hypothetical protein [Pseudomonas synxantha]|uniref:Uncharacterized protein n=1 Tax=Pseudomonas synxantha TaxID=47883 RepID=A0AAU8TXV8_9PSED|nr:hypothetical protein [Pseudomonas synxantha]AKA86389.1 hypothetical protein VO64_5843 [Pseudomonas synxantha]
MTIEQYLATRQRTALTVGGQPSIAETVDAEAADSKNVEHWL